MNKMKRMKWSIPTMLVLSFLAFNNATLHADEALGEKIESGKEVLVTGVRQLTFDGKRSGEGYYAKDGSAMVFQSEREPGNPFYQIYHLDLETGDTTRVSPGYGKTTCAWIHPDMKRVMFASTHDDPQAKSKQAAELKMRAEGKQRRYAWDYDEHFEIYANNMETGETKRLTHATGYDAEGSYSPNGKYIAFASNRHAYEGKLNEADAERLKIDKSYFMDIYIMNADGSNVKRLTTAKGYDGGPFFSADGKKICWRRFSEKGDTAEVYTMNIDGSDQQKLTDMNAMSWAPYYHPSGEYLIYTTNVHGFANFELYLVRADGRGKPVRVTYTDGFDGLPTFSPDGKTLSWTCAGRTSTKKSQIFVGKWNHELAMKMLNAGVVVAEADAQTRQASQSAARERVGAAKITVADLKAHVGYLASEELEGRLTGTKGEKLATGYVGALFEQYGLTPEGDDGSFYQAFEFTSGVKMGKTNEMVTWVVDENGKYAPGHASTPNKEWRPVSFSKSGKAMPTEVVFAGYGMVAPAGDGVKEYDSYVHTDVKGKWVLVFRYMPEGLSAKERQHYARYAGLRYKTMVARDKGAKGLIVVSGPKTKVRNELIGLGSDGSLSGTSIWVLSVTNKVVEGWMKHSKKDLGELQTKLDKGEMMMGFELPKIRVGAKVEIIQERRVGRNVLGRLQAGKEKSHQVILIGAHVDHLGRGSGGSLAREGEEGEIHYGADDNASGVGAMLEIAQWLSDMKKRGKLKMKRDIVFAAWSGEELGLIGSTHYVNAKLNMKNGIHAAAGHAHAHGEDAHAHTAEKQNPHAKEDHKHEHAEDAHAHDHSHSHGGGNLYPQIVACLNMDMIGRFDGKVTIQGIGSSRDWKGLIERANVPVGLPMTLSADPYLPTDAAVFYLRGVPIMSAFTGAHEDYHTPRDTVDKVNYDKAQEIARFMGLVSRSLVMRDHPIVFTPVKRQQQQRRANLRAWLGTIPDYSQGDTKGVKFSGVSKDGPADKGGIRAGDIIIELAGKKIENIYDYTYAIEALKIGQEINAKVKRGEKVVELKLTPGSRD